MTVSPHDQHGSIAIFKVSRNGLFGLTREGLHRGGKARSGECVLGLFALLLTAGGRSACTQQYQGQALEQRAGSHCIHHLACSGAGVEGDGNLPGRLKGHAGGYQYGTLGCANDLLHMVVQVDFASRVCSAMLAQHQ